MPNYTQWLNLIEDLTEFLENEDISNAKVVTKKVFLRRYYIQFINGDCSLKLFNTIKHLLNE